MNNETPNTDDDADDDFLYPDDVAWQIAFKPYAEHQHANAAFDVAKVLMGVKRLLEEKPPRVSIAIAALDEGADTLFPYSEFYNAGYDLYRRVINGPASKADEDLMDTLGITF